MTALWLSSGDPRLSSSRDPEVSRRSLEEAVIDPAQEADRARVLELLDTHGAVLADRTTAPGHLTGSALVVDSDGERVLLMLHAKLRRWLQPGGHADGDADVLAVALREGREESGIAELEALSPEIFDVDVHEIPARKGEPAHLHYDVRFALVAPAGAQLVVSEESHDLAWVPRAEVAHYNTDDSVLRMAAKWDTRT